MVGTLRQNVTCATRKEYVKQLSHLEEHGRKSNKKTIKRSDLEKKSNIC